MWEHNVLMVWTSHFALPVETLAMAALATVEPLAMVPLATL